MKKQTKKILSMFLAVAMVLGLTGNIQGTKEGAAEEAWSDIYDRWNWVGHTDCETDRNAKGNVDRKAGSLTDRFFLYYNKKKHKLKRFSAFQNVCNRAFRFAWNCALEKIKKIQKNACKHLKSIV